MNQYHNICNIFACTTVLCVSYLYPTNLTAMHIGSLPILLHCIIDLSNNTSDMIVHHIAAIITICILGITYEGQDDLAKALVARTFINTEISTISLNLYQMGYNNSLIKILFIMTFFYYRIVQLTRILFFYPETYYWSTAICGTNKGCFEWWVRSTGAIVCLNFYWFRKIIKKFK